MTASATTDSISALFSCPSGRSAYVAKVRATRLSLMTIDKAISSEADAAITPGPYAFWRIIAIPPDEGQAFDILM